MSVKYFHLNIANRSCFHIKTNIEYQYTKLDTINQSNIQNSKTSASQPPCTLSAGQTHCGCGGPDNRSHNSDDAAINAIKSAGDTAWTLDLGDTKSVFCTLNMIARELQKMLNTDFLYAAVGWKKTGEKIDRRQ